MRLPLSPLQRERIRHPAAQDAGSWSLTGETLPAAGRFSQALIRSERRVVDGVATG